MKYKTHFLFYALFFSTEAVTAFNTCRHFSFFARCSTYKAQTNLYFSGFLKAAIRWELKRSCLANSLQRVVFMHLNTLSAVFSIAKSKFHYALQAVIAFCQAVKIM